MFYNKIKPGKIIALLAAAVLVTGMPVKIHSADYNYTSGNNENRSGTNPLSTGNDVPLPTGNDAPLSTGNDAPLPAGNDAPQFTENDASDSSAGLHTEDSTDQSGTFPDTDSTGEDSTPSLVTSPDDSSGDSSGDSSEIIHDIPESEIALTVTPTPPKDLSQADKSTKQKSYIFTGYYRKPAVTVKLDGMILIQGTDYTISYQNNRNVGTASYTVRGTGNYTGTVKGSFLIIPKNLSAAIVKTKSESYPVTGSYRKPVPDIFLDSIKLVIGKDCKIGYKNNKNAGQAVITVKGIGNYTGTATGTFQLCGKTILVPVYRLFSLKTGEHFYTLSLSEKESCVKTGWKAEGIAWYAPKKSRTPIYRLSNPNNYGEHHYTKSANEKDMLVKQGWRYEGIGWYSDDSKTIPVYRHYHPSQKTGNHHYTTSKGESDHIVRYQGWKYEGVSWYAARVGGNDSKDSDPTDTGTGGAAGTNTRILSIDGIYNVRDLGGLHTTDGKTVLYGKILRGSEMDGEHGIAITESGRKKLLQKYGIRFDLDLRDDSEVDMILGTRNMHAASLDNKTVDKKTTGTASGLISSSPLGNTVSYIRIPMKSYLTPWLSSSGGAGAAEEKSQYRDVFRTLFTCVEKNKPVYIHCWAGADRTGTICFLLEGLLGVREGEIANDYEMTSLAKVFGERRVSSGNYQAMRKYFLTLGKTKSLSRNSFDQFFRKELGFTQKEIDSFRRKMTG